MSIPDRRLREAGSEFRDHLTTLLAKTATGKPLVMIPYAPGMIQLSFRDRGLPSTAPLRTRYGTMDLYIGQVCEAVEDEDDGRVRLRTRSYRYTLQPQLMDDPLFRWEYIRYPATDSVYCRHHLQGLLAFEIPDDTGTMQAASLNDWRLPTGWVAIEEVLRFCIVDLGVDPLTSEWDQVLRDSYDEFMAL